MLLETEYEMRDGYLLCLVTSGRSATSMEEALQYIRDFLREAGERGYPDVLVDRRAVVRPRNPVSGTEAFLEEVPRLMLEHGYVQSEDRTLRGRRIGMLVRSEELPAMLTVESVLHSRGVPFRFFDDESAAVAWVRGDESPSR